MKIRDLLFELSSTTGAVPTDDMTFADQTSEREAGADQAPSDFKGAPRVGRNGKNGKKAARIASAAKTAAKDNNPVDGESPGQHGQNMSFLNFRLGK